MRQVMKGSLNCKFKWLLTAMSFESSKLRVVGGVSSFPSFLNKFFPEVLGGKGSNAYCTYNSQKLQIFTSSYFLAGMPAL